MTYQKKLGLPNYSSHSCSVSLTVEIPDVSVAAQESTKLYALLQTAVTARNLLSRPPHRKRSEPGRASGSEGLAILAKC